jgi:hypothetical protein
LRAPRHGVLLYVSHPVQNPDVTEVVYSV